MKKEENMAHKQKKHHPREVDQDMTEKIIVLAHKKVKKQYYKC